MIVLILQPGVNCNSPQLYAYTCMFAAGTPHYSLKQYLKATTPALVVHSLVNQAAKSQPKIAPYVSKFCPHTLLR